MTGFYDNVGEDDLLNADKQLLFPEKTFVRFTIIDAKENAKTGDLILDCQVNSGEHTGKRHSIFISDRDHEIAKKQKAQFVKAFWTVEQLKSGNVCSGDLVSKEFQAKAGKVRKPKDSDTIFQGFTNYQILTDGATTTAPEAATTTSPPTEEVPFATEPPAPGGVA